MIITSLEFVLFVVVLFLVYAVCPGKYRWIILLLGSIAFYLYAGIRFLPFIFVTSFSVWYAAGKIDRIWSLQEDYLKTGKPSSEEKKQRKKQDKRRAKNILILVLFINIGYLVLEKVCHFVDNNVRELPFSNSIIIPLGISYYTFSTIGYLLDVYWKRYEHESNYARFALYTLYFPHITQGPISRYNRLGAELKKPLKVTYSGVTFGLQRILWGCFKKMVIADRVLMYTTSVFSSAYREGALYLAGLFFDVIYIYSDFSGYMDIMCGISQMFGVEMEENFNRPFFSKTVPEFWRRWHMSLGGWFKDYVYYPIVICKPYLNFTKRLKGKKPEILSRLLATSVPILITWILTGLWHGTGAGYLAWGLYYGVLITLSNVLGEKLAEMARKTGLKTDCFSYRLFQMMRMFCIFAGGRLLTKMDTLTDSLRVLKRILFNTRLLTFFDGSLYEYGLNKFNFTVAMISIGVLWIVSLLQNGGSVRERIAKQNIVFRWLIYIIGLFAVILYGIYGSEFSMDGFAYQQF